MNDASELPPSPPRSRGALTFAAVIIGLFFVGLMGLLYYGVKQSDRAGRDALPSPLIGKPAPVFERPLLHRGDVQFSSKDLLGQVWIFNVWASWCGPCRQEHPLFNDLAAQKLVPIVGMNYKDQPGNAMKWLNELGDPYKLTVVDADGRLGIIIGLGEGGRGGSEADHGDAEQK